MRRPVIVVAAIAALAIAGVVVASTPGAAADACYDTKSGLVRVDVTGEGCRSKEVPITLGAPLTTRWVASDPETALSGNYQDAFAACAAGEVVTGGGFLTDSINPLVRANQDMPVEFEGIQGWYIVVVNHSEVDIDFTAFAVCAPGTGTGFPD
jgi:hypothetical protein